MTNEQSDGEHTPSGTTGETAHTPDAQQVGQDVTAPLEHDRTASHDHAGAPSGATGPIPPQPDPALAEPATPPTRLARFGSRWRTSLPMRVATAVIAVLVIGALGFAAGTAVSGDNGHSHARHELTADHPFWQDHTGWIHKHTHPMSQHLHLVPNAPAATPAQVSSAH